VSRHTARSPPGVTHTYPRTFPRCPLWRRAGRRYWVSEGCFRVEGPEPGARLLATVGAELGDSERLAVAAEISSALENYHRIFSTASPSEIANQIYGLPLTVFLPDGKSAVRNTEKDVEIWIKGFIAKFKEQGWHRSYMPAPEKRVLGEGLGFASLASVVSKSSSRKMRSLMRCLSSIAYERLQRPVV
jgi:hypothetical protein